MWESFVNWLTGLSGVRAVIGFFKAIIPAVKKLCSFSPGIARQKAEVAKAEAHGKAEAAKIEAQGEMDVAKIKAQGAADVKKIEVQSMIEIGKMEASEDYRARWRRKNAELTVREAVNHMSSDNLHENAEKLRNLSSDWAIHAIEAAESTSESYMQSLWAKILGGEAECPGSFSKQTISIVKNMSQKDALMFTDFCQFVWGHSEGNNVPLIYSWHDEIYQAPHPLFDVTHQLAHLRLISLENAMRYAEIFPKSSAICTYHGVSVCLGALRKDAGGYAMRAGHATFTEAGKQLYRICRPPKNNAFFQYTLDKWREFGYNPVIQEKGAEE